MYPLAAVHQPLISRRSLNPSLRHPDLTWLSTVLADSPCSCAISSGDSPPRNLDTALNSALVSQELIADARSSISVVVVSLSESVSPVKISWAN